MITEMDRIKMIIAEGAKKGLVLSKFIDLQIDDFKQSDTFKEMVEGSKYYKNQGDIEDKQRIIIAENGAEQVAPHAKNYKLKHPIIYKMINQKAGYLLRKKPTIKQVLAKNEKEDEEYKDLLKDLFNNKMHKRLKYTLIEAVKRGIAWWQIYIDENGDLKYEFEWGERPYVFMGYVRRDFDRKTVIVGAKTYTKYVGDYYVAFEPENKRFVPIYPITDEAWKLYGHTMLEGNKILAANPKYVKVIDIPSRKVLAKYEPEETIYSATFLTKNKGAIFTNRGVYEFTF